MKKYTCVDLFCGCGGLSKGFLDAGFDVVLGVDYDDAALKTFKMNHGEAEALKIDLFNHDNIYQIKDYLDAKDINLDVLVGGPPCQGFSIAGPRDMNDKRNSLYVAMVKLADLLKPRAVVLENVPGMLTTNNGIGAKRIVEDFAKIGYKMTPKLLYAPEYGVPQIRKRVFFVGFLDQNTEYRFPAPLFNKESFVSCEDAIGDLPALEGIYGEEIQEYTCEPRTEYQKIMRMGSTEIYNHIGSIHEEKTVELLKLIPEGKNYKALPPELAKRFKYHEALTRYHSKKPSLTINTGHRSHFHYKYNRIPTVRESARLQSFPDTFVFFGTKAEQYRQVGNAVPPLLAEKVAYSIKDCFDSEDNEALKIVDLFAGCGGLTEGFLSTGKYKEIAAVEWLLPQINTLRNRLKTKWKENDADQRAMRFDIQRDEELFVGWHDDPDFDSGLGLDHFINQANGIDVIIGGPPCQAYSVAGRVRDENGMREDYRNYLFEHYLNVVNKYRPKLFVFENVPGILSAAPAGTPITTIIRNSFNDIGYEILDNLKLAVVNAADYGVPQNRHRVVIIGLNKQVFNDCQEQLKRFYDYYLPRYKVEKSVSVKEAIGNLPPCMPYFDIDHHSKKQSHSIPECTTSWHKPRYSNLRDMSTFKLLAEDLQSGRCEYNSKKISELYEEKIGSKSPIHRYHVLNPDEPSTTIIAHLYKDGNRYIHYDPDQQRTITVREAARLQSFPDDFDFIGSMGQAYQMIGNAVPPILAKAIGNAVFDFVTEY